MADIVLPPDLDTEKFCALIAERLSGRTQPPHNTVIEDDGSVWIEYRFWRDDCDVIQRLRIAPGLLDLSPKLLREKIAWPKVESLLAEADDRHVHVLATGLPQLR